MQGIKLSFSQSSICIKYIYLLVPSEADSMWALSTLWNNFIPNWKSWISQGVRDVWFSRPLFQAVSCSFFTVKQILKAGYYKLHISEISQSWGPRHHNVLHLTWSHMAHHLKTFEQGSFFTLKMECEIFFLQREECSYRNCAWTKHWRKASVLELQRAVPCHQDWVLFHSLQHTHICLPPKMQNEPSKPSETKESLWMSLELSLLSFLYCHWSKNEYFHNEAKVWL